MARLSRGLALTVCPLALTLILSGARATLSGTRAPKIKTEADHQFLQCSTALTLLRQSRNDEALSLLRRYAQTPIPLTTDSTLSTEISPGSQVILLSQCLIHEAEKAARRGDAAQASAYLEQCHTLSRRILATPQSESGLRIARAVEKVTLRAEEQLQEPRIRG